MVETGSGQRPPRAVGIAFILLAVGALGVFARGAHGGSFPLLGTDGGYHFVYYAVLFGASGLLLARSVLSPRDRIAWASLGIGLAMWSFGGLYWLLALRGTGPSATLTVADVLNLGAYPFLYGGVIALARAQLPHL